MSWLSERQRRRQSPRPYTVTELAVAIGLNPSDPRLTSQLVGALGMSRGWVLRCRTLGLTEDQADVWATRAGMHPMSIWPLWGSGLRGVALVNAHRTHCVNGHVLDRVNTRGERYCSTCRREIGRRHKLSRKHLLSAHITVLADHRAPPVLLDDRMPRTSDARRRERITARVLPDVAEQIAARADEAGITVTAWACMTLTAAVRQHDAAATTAEEHVA